MSPKPIMLCMIARVPRAGVAAFRAYEAAVLPLLADHGGVLERRVASEDGTFEMHLVRFATDGDLERYRASPERAAVQALLASSGAVIETTRVEDL